jgi:uncharacterized protein YprB with RNaseH-like and TPR domain
MAILESIDRVLNRKGRAIKKEMEPTEFRCIHRHSKESHPNCFRRGIIKDFQWWKDKNLELAFFDIETTSFEANSGFMTCWAMKRRGKKAIIGSRITKEEIYAGPEVQDKRIVENLMEELKTVDILVSYYGTGFDNKFMRSRAFFHDLYFPPYGTIYNFDLYYRARSLLKLHRSSLDAMTRFLGIKGKTHPHIDDWMRARYGDEKALKFVWDHCVADIRILEKLFYKLEDYSKWTKRSI